MTTVNELLAVLERRACFEAVDVQESPHQVRVMGRVRTSGTTATIINWLSLVRSILLRAQTPGCPWRMDISKSYFLRGDKVVYGWRLVLQATQAVDADVRKHLSDVLQAIQHAPPAASALVEEVPLLGVTKNRNTLQNGRGASSLSEAPLIARMQQRGG